MENFNFGLCLFCILCNVTSGGSRFLGGGRVSIDDKSFLLATCVKPFYIVLSGSVWFISVGAREGD